MPLEIEAKIRLENPSEMAANLRRAHAKEIGQYFEINTFYDTPDQSLLKSHAGLRIRNSTELATKKSTCIITHKGPLHAGDLKTREETELEAANADDADRLLAKLGFEKNLRFEKRRHSWKLNDCKIELDEIPRLGHFIEIEGPSGQSIQQIRTLLGMTNQPLIKTSYAAMLSEYAQQHKLDPQNIRF